MISRVSSFIENDVDLYGEAKGQIVAALRDGGVLTRC
jgi:hypothetical protein